MRNMPTACETKGHRAPRGWRLHGEFGPVAGNAPFVRVALLETAGTPKSAIQDMMTSLDPDERKRAGRLVSEQLRTDFVAAHHLLRQLLSWSFELPPGDWQIGADKEGKPLLLSPEFHGNVHLSLSHTQGLVAAAISRDCRVGVDVENVDGNLAWLDIADRFFCPNEAKFLRSGEHDDPAAQFAALWTLKEAFVKAIGKGFGQRLNSFSFAHPDVRTVEFDDPALGNPACWCFSGASLGVAHISLAQECVGKAGSFAPVEAVWLRGAERS